MTVLNDTAALCTAPPRDETTANASTAEAVQLRVSLNGVDFSPSNLTWRYLAPPEVTAIAPRAAAAAGTASSSCSTAVPAMKK